MVGSMPGGHRSDVPEHDEHRFDAFVSYSHAADGEFAPALRLGLERMAKPWYRRRALSVFLDTSGLEVTPTLWGTISAALTDSRHLVLMCSPTSAASEWVDREVRFWLEHRSASTILLVVTEGEVSWDSSANRFDASSTALPPALLEAFAEEPAYVDLRNVDRDADLLPRDPQFRSGIAQLVAGITGRSMTEIYGDDLREHRRTRRTAWAAATGLAVLLVASLIAGFIAKANGDEATRQRDTATSRLLAAQADVRSERDPQLATLFSLAARRLDDSGDARGALVRMAERQRSVLGYLSGHAGLVETTAFSTDGTLVATAGPTSPVRLWNVQERRVVADLPTGSVSRVAFTPDGTTLVIGTQAGIELWDVAGLTQRSVLPFQAAALAVSADGKRLIGATTRGYVVVYDLTSSAQLVTLPGLTRYPTAIAISPDGRYAAAGDLTGTGIVWDTTSGNEITRTTEYSAPDKGAAAFSPDGQTLVMSRNRTDMSVLSIPTLTWRPVRGHSAPVIGLQFVDADSVVSSGRDGSLGRWSLTETDRWEWLRNAPITMTTGSVLSPDGRTVVSGNFDGTAVLWDLGPRWATRMGSLGSATTTASDPEGRRVATIGAEVNLGGVTAGNAVEIISTDGSSTLTVPLSVPAPSVAVATDVVGLGHVDGTVSLLDLTTGQVRATLRTASSEPVVSVAFSADGRFAAAGGFSGSVTVWSLPDGNVYAELKPPDNPVDDEGIFTRVVFSPDSVTLAHSSLAGGLQLWDVRNRTMRAELKGSNAVGTSSLAFNPSGTLLAQGGQDNNVALWDTTTGDEVAVLAGVRSAVYGVSFSSDGLLAAGGAGNAGVIVWDVARRTQQAQLQPGTTGTEPIFLPGGVLLITDLTGIHRYDLGADAVSERLCGLVGREMTEEEWNDYVVGQEYGPLCGP